MPLGKVFDLIYEKTSGEAAIDSKVDGGRLKSWFEDILPDYSRDKVYVSDMKKVALWYNILHRLNMLIKEDPEAEEKNETESEAEAKKDPAIPAATAKKKSTRKPKAQ